MGVFNGLTLTFFANLPGCSSDQRIQLLLQSQFSHLAAGLKLHFVQVCRSFYEERWNSNGSKSLFSTKALEIVLRGYQSSKHIRKLPLRTLSTRHGNAFQTQFGIRFFFLFFSFVLVLKEATGFRRSGSTRLCWRR